MEDREMQNQLLEWEMQDQINKLTCWYRGRKNWQFSANKLPYLCHSARQAECHYVRLILLDTYALDTYFIVEMMYIWERTWNILMKIDTSSAF